MATKKLDTRLESEGAEFLVLGHLLLHKIPAYKTYTNMPGYDLVATNPERKKLARIQVKSRWHTGANGFPIKNFDCDFVVVALLKRGSKDGKRKVMDPVYYVLPVSLVKALPDDKNKFSKRYLRDVKNLDFYKENWAQIAAFLAL